VRDIVETYLVQIKPWYDDLVKQLYSASGNGGNDIEQEENTQEESK